MSNKQSKHYYALFLIQPLFALVRSFRDYTNGAYKNILWFFIVFYAYNITVPKGDNDMDIARRIDYFYSISHRDYDTYDQFIQDFNDESYTSSDFFEPFLVYGVSKITNDVQILFLMYGLLFGYFYSRNIAFALDSIPKNLLRKIWPVFFLYAFMNPFWNINGFRFWFATHVFLYGLILFLIHRKKKGILFMLATPFIHFSFIFSIAIFLLYFIAGSRLKIYYYFFVISSFIGEIKIPFVNEALANFSEPIQRKGESYTNDEYVEKVVELKNIDVNWYVNFVSFFSKWYIFIAMILIYQFHKKTIEKSYPRYISFVYLYMGCATLLSGIPSMGRFLTVSSLFFLFFFLQFQVEFQQQKWLQNFNRFSFYGLLIVLVVQIRMGFDTISFITVFTNPFIAPFSSEINFSMIDLFK